MNKKCFVITLECFPTILKFIFDFLFDCIESYKLLDTLSILFLESVSTEWWVQCFLPMETTVCLWRGLILLGVLGCCINYSNIPPHINIFTYFKIYGEHAHVYSLFIDFAFKMFTIIVIITSEILSWFLSYFIKVCAATAKGRGDRSGTTGTTSEIGILIFWYFYLQLVLIHNHNLWQ
jgi:hypothetical protein